MKEQVFNRRHHNYVVSIFDKQSPVPEVNPYYLMRFDCRQINDILTFWPAQDLNILVSACNDGYLRVFNLLEHSLISTVRSIFGSPLCLDLSKDKNLLAAGFEDDSFVLYSLYFGVGP